MNFHLEHHIAELLYKSIRGELSDFERQELNQWRADSPMHETLFMRLQNDEYIDEELGVFIKGEEKNSVLWGRIRENSILRKKKRFIRFFHWGAAAVLLLVICVSLFIKKGEQEVVPIAIQTILPGSHKATLLMENGKEIELSDSVRMSIEQGIIVSNNQLKYGDSIKELASGYYHVLKIPRGGEYCLKLSDGTVVYLNSDSELRYPVSFSATSREVELRGEAFFEVITDPQRPFVVNAEQVRVRVLGTSFNVNSYADENYTEVTLVEGHVAAYVDDKSYDLLPSRQLRWDKESESVDIRTVNVNDYIAWKKGQYVFKGRSLEEVAKVLERWYDMEIIFENEKSKKTVYTGVINKEENFDAFVLRLRETSSLSCRMESNRLYIK